MSGTEYPKIQTLFDRDNKKFVLIDQLRFQEFGNIIVWHLTEKIHGKNIRVTLFGSGEVEYGLRKAEEGNMTPELLEYLKKTFPPEKLKSAFWISGKTHPVHATIYGEAYGADMAHGSKIYRKDISFRLFDCLVDIYWLERPNLEDVARKLEIKCVPSLGTIDYLPISIDQLEKIFEENKNNLVFSQESEKDYVSARPEGIVARTEPLLYFRNGGKIERLMWKLKIKDFKPKELIKLKWKWESLENKIEWKLIYGDGDDVIGTIIATNQKPDIENGWNIIGECEKTQYKEIWENQYKKDIKFIISNMKKFMQESVEKIVE